VLSMLRSNLYEYPFALGALAGAMILFVNTALDKSAFRLNLAAAIVIGISAAAILNGSKVLMPDDPEGFERLYRNGIAVFGCIVAIILLMLICKAIEAVARHQWPSTTQ